MNKSISKKLILTALIAIVSTGLSFGQKSYALKGTITVDGTSNTHDWTVKSESLNGTFTMTGNSVESITVKVPVESLKSILESKFERKQMENLILKAFNNEKYPTITFQLTDSFIPTQTGSSAVTVSGNLNMNGVTKKITFKADGKQIAGGGFQYRATVPLKFTEYGMKPPVALMIMRVKDPVTVKLDINIPALN